MTTPMTMNRVVHAAVRRDLARLESALGAARDGDVARARELERAYANLHEELTRHHEGEDDVVFPFLAESGAPSDLLKSMDEEHHAMAGALAETRPAMAAYASSGSATDAARARASIARTQAVVDQHLTHEENDLEPVIQPHVGTTAWKAVEKKLRPRSPAVTGRFVAWIQDGMTDEGRRYLRATIPPPVTFLLSRLAGRKYHRDIAPTWRR
ncbi:MAG TPA: hemerythrin domain-containing protein [Mycobacteriales bacterium]